MSEHHHHRVGIGKLLQALTYMGSAGQLGMHWLVVLVHYFQAAVLMYQVVQLTTVALICLDPQNENQQVRLGGVLLLVELAAVSLTSSANIYINV